MVARETTGAGKESSVRAGTHPPEPEPIPAEIYSEPVVTPDRVVAAEPEIPAAPPPEEEAPDAPPSPIADGPVQVIEKRTGFTGVVLGGVIAAGLGFGLAQVAPGGWFGTDVEAPLTALESRIDAAMAEAADARAQLSARIEDSLAHLDDATARSDLLDARLGAATGDLSSLSDRVGAIERRPITDTGAEVAAAVAAFERRLEALRDRIDTLSDQFQTLNDQFTDRLAATERLGAETEAAIARARDAATLNALGTVLDTGQPFSRELSALEREAPPALADWAETGVPSLADLQSGFANAARSALIASIKVTAGDGAMDRFMAFLRVQTGARSLEARAGDDPDAILSRAEEAVRDGRLSEAIEILETLPPEGLAPMSDWIARTTARRDALEAFATLSGVADRN
ncbi:MAG: hypothetical protein AAF982_09005 [Pseudomonadota bacterium]